MNNFLSPEIQIVLQEAKVIAADLSHPFCMREHLFLALIKNPTVLNTLLSARVKIEEIKSELNKYLKSGNIDPDSYVEGLPDNVDLTPAVDQLFQIAFQYVRGAGKDVIKPLDLLLAFFESQECVATYLLMQQGFDKKKIIKHVVESGVAVPENKEYLINLNQKAKKGSIDAVIGRENEIERVIQVLCRRKKNNPILVGEPGVGKTAIAEGLALKIVNKEVPDALKNAVILSLDIGQLMAGTKYRGDFEEKMKDMLKTLKQIPNAILFIDEIHTIIGAGAAGGGSLDTANMLKPLLSSGELKCIGATTYKEFNNIFEKDAALARRFQKVDVVEPTIEDTIKILKGLKADYEKHHGVTYTEDALRSAAELSVKYINDRFLPDKAIDVLDEAGTSLRLKSGSKSVTTSVIEKIIAKIARIPEKSVSTEKKSKLKNLASELRLTIFGQDPAVDSVVSAIELSSSGLRSGEKPIGSFLFCGPTGVGKTELCKQLALNLGIPFIRFDMSEYGEKHTVARLIGAPPGYVGFDQAGLLTDAARKNPHAVILLDEIEKSHSDIWNILLQVMDHGTLTDNNGRKADFRNCIIIMTSNVGAQEFSRPRLGLGATTQSVILDAKPVKAVETTFTPEFRNRLDGIVYFNALSHKNIVDVLDKNITELQGQLLAQKVEITIEPSAKEWLANKGYDPRMGARPMARLIQDTIKRPLSSEILYGKLESGGKVRAFLEGDSIKFEFTSSAVKKSVKKYKPIGGLKEKIPVS